MFGWRRFRQVICFVVSFEEVAGLSDGSDFKDSRLKLIL
jgi:hypothetical protein